MSDERHYRIAIDMSGNDTDAHAVTVVEVRDGPLCVLGQLTGPAAEAVAARIATLEADLVAARTELESHANQELSWKTMVDSLRADLAREKADHEKDLARASEITRGALADLDKARADLARVTGELEKFKRQRLAAVDAAVRWRRETMSARRDLEEAAILIHGAGHETDSCRCCCGFEATEPCGFGNPKACFEHRRAAFLATHPAPEPKESR